MINVTSKMEMNISHCHSPALTDEVRAMFFWPYINVQSTRHRTGITVDGCYLNFGVHRRAYMVRTRAALHCMKT